MAIQIWDAQAGQYKSADLARFGGSGTLKEALVWDGTEYVKVWPSGPSYPLVGEWADTAGEVIFHEWTVPTSGEYTIGATASVTATMQLLLYIMLNESDIYEVGDGLLGAGGRFDPGAVNAEWTGTLNSGDTIYWYVGNYPAGDVTATWSITQV